MELVHLLDVLGHHPPRPIGGQFQRFQPLQLVSPVAQQRLQLFALEVIALPDGVVGILNRQRRKPRRPARAHARRRFGPPRGPARPATSRRRRRGGWSTAARVPYRSAAATARATAVWPPGRRVPTPARRDRLCICRAAFLLRQMPEVFHRQIDPQLRRDRPAPVLPLRSWRRWCATIRAAERSR